MSYTKEHYERIYRRAQDILELTQKAKDVRSLEVTFPKGYDEIHQFEIYVYTKLSELEKLELQQTLTACLDNWKNEQANQLEGRRDWIINNFNNGSDK